LALLWTSENHNIAWQRILQNTHNYMAELRQRDRHTDRGESRESGESE